MHGRSVVALASGAGTVVHSQLVEGAYASLLSGDQDRHDELITEAIIQAGDADAIVLAQASMARVLPGIPAQIAARCLPSPPFAVEDVLDRLAPGSVR